MTEFRAGHIGSIPPNEGRMLRVAGHLVAVFHLRQGGVQAVQPWCPHRRGPLVDGLVGDGTLVCPLHGRSFDLATGEATRGETGLASYPARVDADGIILLELPADGPLPCKVDDDAPIPCEPPPAPFAERI